MRRITDITDIHNRLLQLNRQDEELISQIDNALRDDDLSEEVRNDYIEGRDYFLESIRRRNEIISRQVDTEREPREPDEQMDRAVPAPQDESLAPTNEGEQESEEQEGSGILLRDPTILPPSARQLLEQIGNEEIKSIKIVRTPLSTFTKGFLNIISLGQFDKISKQYYDKIFHLSLWINDKYNLEKNEVITFNKKNPIEQNSEVQQVNNIPTGLTFQTLIDKTKARMGNNFGPYDAETNNCQDFLMNIFQANGIGEQSDYNFIKQDTKEIFTKLPEFSKAIGQASTSIAAIFNRLLYGEGQTGNGCQCGNGSLYNYQLANSKCKF